MVDKAEAYVALSHAEARYYAGVTDAGKIHTIPNGIPADIFRAAGRREKRADKPRYDVLYVGQLIDWKGVNFLLEAMERLRKRRPVHLRLVYHNAELEADLRRQARHLGIAGDVEFVGIRGPNELAEEYHQADLLVLPSFADCLPSVITEAFLCGTPVVAGGVCGVPEQIGPYGLTVPPGDPVALASAMETVLADRPRWQGLAGEIRAYAEQRFKPETMVARHLALYRDLIEGRTAPAQTAGRLDGSGAAAGDRGLLAPPAGGGAGRRASPDGYVMKISHISVSTLPVLHRFGGAIERRIVEIAQEQARRGHRVSVYSVGDTAETREVNGVTYHFLRCRTRLPFRHLEFQYQVVRALQRRSEDVLHFHSQPEGAWMSRAVPARKVLSYDFFQLPRRSRDAALSPVQACAPPLRPAPAVLSVLSGRVAELLERSRRQAADPLQRGQHPAIPARSRRGGARARAARHRPEGDALRRPGLRAEGE